MQSRLMDNQRTGRSRLFWTDAMDKTLIDLLVEHAQNGGTEGPSYRKSAWYDMMARFNAKARMDVEIDQLRNRLKFYRREFNIVKELKNLPGFRWDKKKQLMVADDLSWNQYFAKRPTARYYKKKSVACYKDLKIICGSLAVTGSNSAQDVDAGEEDIIEGVDRTEGSEESKPFTEAISTNDEAIPTTNVPNCVEAQVYENPSGLDHHKRQRSCSASAMTHVNKGNRCEGGEPLVTIAKAPETDNRVPEGFCTNKLKGLDDCLVELNAIEDLEDDLYVKALFILRDEYNRFVFLNTSGHRRMAWLRAVTRDVVV